VGRGHPRRGWRPAFPPPLPSCPYRSMLVEHRANKDAKADRLNGPDPPVPQERSARAPATAVREAARSGIPGR
jgi:hypothetical protein